MNMTPSSASNAAIARFRLLDLPRELQTQILSFTVLIPRFRPVTNCDKDGYHPQGIWIHDGKLREPFATMFRVSRGFSTLSKEVMFTPMINRFNFSGDWKLNKQWLQAQSARDRAKIHKVDFVLLSEDWAKFHGQDVDFERLNPDTGFDGLEITLQNEYERSWLDLISSLPELLRISQLQLSVDAGFHNVRLFERDSELCCHPESEVPLIGNYYRSRYLTVFWPFEVNKDVLSKLKAYLLFLPVHRHEETRFERLLMGKEYDNFAVQLNIDLMKDLYGSRDPRIPHDIWEWLWISESYGGEPGGETRGMGMLEPLYMYDVCELHGRVTSTVCRAEAWEERDRRAAQ